MSDPRFPELTQKQITILKQYGSIESCATEMRLFNLGDPEYDFFVILEGSVILEDPHNSGNIIVELGKNKFTGNIGMLSSRMVQFRGIAKTGTTLLRIRPERLKQAITKHSAISEMLLSAFIQRHESLLSEYAGGIKLGSGNSKKTYDIRDFMDKNHIWYNFLDVDASDEANHLLKSFDLSKSDLPILVNSEGEVCQNPTLEVVARYSGVLIDLEDKIFDLLVIGAGPSGLAASVYAASEGLDVVTIDANAPGGQAGKSSKIENYLGFPTGISGSDLANRAYIQAQKFGCKISIPHKAERIEHTGEHFILNATNGRVIKTKAIIAATGANYRQLPIHNIEEYEGSGVYYSASRMNSSECKDELVGVVGGANSAGQAALFLSDYAEKVHIIVRAGDLSTKMSDYLVQRIKVVENIEVHYHTEVAQLKGTYHLESLVMKDADGRLTEKKITNLFTFIGATPCTDWLDGLVSTDSKGFIRTGAEIEADNLSKCEIYQNRKPQSLETSIPGFFAVGDVRKGSVKHVASAVGEGSMAVSQVHRFLGELANQKRVML
jgi:thioredoxin reductase (NADPH)